ncbi:MAG: MFS transporter [Alphaproteobacteria bacterium]|nr:MFS transporter [Alphaproteobacteria bacterium]
MFTVSDKTALSLLKWSEFFIYFMIITPIIVLLYQEKGITTGDFFLIQGIFLIATFLFEIPSGYMSDVFSRKKVLLLGSIMWFLAMVGLFFAYGFWEIMLAEAGLGLAGALFSGTKEAYAYDLLKRMKREKQFLKENGSISTYGQSAGFIAAVIGGSLYAVIGNWVVAIEAMVAFFGVLCILALPELQEVRRKVFPETSPWKDVMGIVKMSVKHPEIKWLMLFPAIFGSFTLIMMWILQPTMEAVGVSVALFGIFVGINQFSRILFAKYAHKVYESFGVRKTLYACIAAVVIAIAAVFGALFAGAEHMWIVYVMCVIIAIVPACQKMSSLIFNTLIHHRIKSSERGTVLSVSSMYATFISGGMMILMKPLMDGFGIGWTMAVTLVMLVAILYPLKKVLAIKEI